MMQKRAILLLHSCAVIVCICGSFFIFLSRAYAQNNPLQKTIVPFGNSAIADKNLFYKPVLLSPSYSQNPWQSNNTLFDNPMLTRPSSRNPWLVSSNPSKEIVAVETGESKQLAEIIFQAKKSPNIFIKGAITTGKTVIFVLVIYDNYNNTVTFLNSDKDTVAITQAFSRGMINLPATTYALRQTGALAPSFIAAPLRKSLEKLSLQATRFVLKNKTMATSLQVAKNTGRASFKTLSSLPLIVVTFGISLVQQCVDLANEAHDMQTKIDELESVKKECTSLNLEDNINKLTGQWSSLHDRHKDLTNDEYEKMIELENAIHTLESGKKECLAITEQIDDWQGDILWIKDWIKRRPYCPSGII